MTELPRCEHQYLPEDDEYGTVYTCGWQDETVILTEFGWLCEAHRED